MICRFKGPFTEGDWERITTAARAVEQLRGATSSDPSWAVLHFNTPYSGYRYCGASGSRIDTPCTPTRRKV